MSDTKERDKKASQFARGLLMPEKHIYEQANKLINATESKSMKLSKLIAEMAKIFEVSKPTMTARLVEIGIIESIRGAKK